MSARHMVRPALKQYMHRPQPAARGSQPDWTPLDLGDSLTAWLDFSQAATLFTDTAGTVAVAAENERVRSVRDASGRGLLLVYGNNPLYYKKTLHNGRDMVRFSELGTLGWLVHDSFTTGLIERTVWIVARENTTVGNAGLCVIGHVNFFNDYDNPQAVVFDTHAHPGNFSVTGSTSFSYQPILGDASPMPLAIHLERKTAGVGSIYRGGGVGPQSEQATDSAFTEFASISGPGLLIGCRKYGGSMQTGHVFQGDYGELGICDRMLTVAESNELGRYLAAKWGLVWADVS